MAPAASAAAKKSQATMMTASAWGFAMPIPAMFGSKVEPAPSRLVPRAHTLSPRAPGNGPTKRVRPKGRDGSRSVRETDDVENEGRLHRTSLARGGGDPAATTLLGKKAFHALVAESHQTSTALGIYHGAVGAAFAAAATAGAAVEWAPMGSSTRSLERRTPRPPAVNTGPQTPPMGHGNGPQTPPRPFPNGPRLLATAATGRPFASSPNRSHSPPTPSMPRVHVRAREISLQDRPSGVTAAISISTTKV